MSIFAPVTSVRATNPLARGTRRRRGYPSKPSSRETEAFRQLFSAVRFVEKQRIMWNLSQRVGMATGTVATFETSLDRLDVDWTHATAAELDTVLEEIATEPAVGTPLPFDVALPEWVNTSPTPRDIDEATTGITAAGLGIASYGSVVLPSTPEGTEPVSLFPDLHVAVLRASDVVPGMPEAFDYLGEAFRGDGHSSAIIATGPSATADMGELVKGAHGPKDVHVVMLDE
jgi:L-lactate dehydrogenase complex protein LldG